MVKDGGRIILDQDFTEHPVKYSRFPLFTLVIGTILLFFFIALTQIWMFVFSAILMIAGVVHSRLSSDYQKDKIYWSAVLGCAVFSVMYLLLVIRYFL